MGSGYPNRFNENWKNTIQTNVTLEQKLDFITKNLKFVGRFGYDTYNDNTIKRHKWPGTMACGTVSQ